MQVFIGRGFSGEILKMEIDAESSPEKQMTNLVYKLFGENAINGSFTLLNVTRGFEYSSKDTFKDNTGENDILLLVNSNNYPVC